MKPEESWLPVPVGPGHTCQIQMSGTGHVECGTVEA